jgi:hypothetical protein
MPNQLLGVLLRTLAISGLSRSEECGHCPQNRPQRCDGQTRCPISCKRLNYHFFPEASVAAGLEAVTRFVQEPRSQHPDRVIWIHRGTCPRS